MKGRTILVVEDNEDVRNVVCVYLKSKSYDVVEAVDGKDGLEKAIAIQPDLVLFDVLLPHKDGIQALRELRSTEQGAHVPVVMMSAVLQTRDIVSETRDLNVHAIVQKPFQVRKLLDVLEHAMGVSSTPIEPSANSKYTVKTGASHTSPVGRRRHVTVRTSLPSDLVASTPHSPGSADAGQSRNLIIHGSKDVEVRGNLRSVSLPEIFVSLFHENATGRIRIVNASVEKRIYFNNGFPVYAESSLSTETLGAYLVTRGVLSRAQHEAALSQMKATGVQYGAALLALDILGPHQLFSELEAHLFVKITSAFSWEDGEYLFEYGDTWKDDVVLARLSVGRVLFEGIREHWSVERVLKLLPIKESYTVELLDNCRYGDSELGLNTLELRVLQFAIGGHDVAKVIDKVGDRRLVMTTLLALYLVGKIAFVRRESGRVESASPRTRKNVSIHEIEQRMMTEYLKYRTADYFTLLGVKQDATTDEIFAAFDRLRKRYHPDAIVGVSGEVNEKIEELNLRVHKAYEVLSTESDRARYTRELRHQEEEPVNTLLSSRTKTGRYVPISGKAGLNDKELFEKGVSLLRDGDYAGARELFHDAEVLSRNGRNAAYLLWATVLCGEMMPEAAMSKLKEVSRDNGQDASVFYILGVLAVRMKNSQEAIRHFEKAIALDPNHIDSARQLRLLRMRQSESSGFFEVLKRKKKGK